MTDHALVIEAMLLRWGENHSSGRTVTLQLPEEDFPHPFKGMKCGPANGQRLAVSIALIDDDETETPVQQPDEAKATPGEDYVPPPIDEYDSMGNRLSDGEIYANKQPVPPAEPEPDPYHYQRQAGMRCAEGKFQVFLDREHAFCRGTDEAAEIVRRVCNVQSRKEFDTDPEAAKRWRGLLAEFDVWKVT